MDRRKFLVSAGAGGLAVAGGATLASVTRADIPFDGLTRGRGSPATIRRTITNDDVTYHEVTNEVSTSGSRLPFDVWASRECNKIGARNVVQILEDRLDRELKGVGSGVRHLIFGPVITVDHNVTLDQNNVVNEPNVSLDRLISVTPRTITTTIHLAGTAYSNTTPVGVGHHEVSAD